MLLTFIQCCLLPVVVIAYSVLSDVVMMATLITVLGYSYFGACMHVYTGCGSSEDGQLCISQWGVPSHTIIRWYERG